MIQVDLLLRANYMVGNPSAWSSYDERASEMIRDLVAALEASRSPVSQKEAVPVGYVSLKQLENMKEGYSGLLHPSPDCDTDTAVYLHPAPGEPAVKALEWIEDLMGLVYSAATSIGLYRIGMANSGYWVRIEEQYLDIARHDTLDAAKAAAQADYEARIRSALHLTPPPVSAPVEGE
jgi:hypothetical protein